MVAVHPGNSSWKISGLIRWKDFLHGFYYKARLLNDPRWPDSIEEVENRLREGEPIHFSMPASSESEQTIRETINQYIV